MEKKKETQYDDINIGHRFFIYSGVNILILQRMGKNKA